MPFTFTVGGHTFHYERTGNGSAKWSVDGVTVSVHDYLWTLSMMLKRRA
jgi:hypothetical protein